MFLNVFNSIIFDENVDLSSCQKNQYLRSQLTEYEMSVVVPLMHGLLSAQDFDEFLERSFWKVDYLQKKLPINTEKIGYWRTNEFSPFDKYSLTFFIVSEYLETLRQRDCLSN